MGGGLPDLLQYYNRGFTKVITKFVKKKQFLSLTLIFSIKNNPIANYIHMKEQRKRKIQQFHPEIEEGTDLRRLPYR